MAVYRQVTIIDAPIEEVFAFHLDLNNLLRISPPEMQLRVARTPERFERGAQIDLVVKDGPISTRMEMRIEEFEPPVRFVDRQLKGLFALWVHTHLFESLGQRKTKLTDEIEYVLPFGLLGTILGGGYARGKLERMFRHRAAMTKRLVEAGE